MNVCDLICIKHLPACLFPLRKRWRILYRARLVVVVTMRDNCFAAFSPPPTFRHVLMLPRKQVVTLGQPAAQLRRGRRRVAVTLT